MEKLLLRIAILLITFSVMPSWSITINDGGDYNGQDVGQLDSLITQQFHNGSGGNPAGETTWANFVVQAPATSVTYSNKFDPVTYYSTDTTNHYAFLLADNIDYFLIKNANYRALYQNVDKLGWGVFDTSPLLEGFNLGDGHEFQISHVTQFTIDGITTSNIPEPQTIYLLLIGLICLLTTRFKKN